MKTREAAKMLYALARLLESCPNIEVEHAFSANAERRNTRKEMSSDQLMVNLDTLIKLSSIDKQQWIDFVNSNNISIELRPRDASRDVLGKILKYLEKNPEQKLNIQKKVESIASDNSLELTNALRLLLRRS